jgi:hypothetical protein
MQLGRFTSRRVSASLCSLWLKAYSHIACRAHVVPLPRLVALIHTCHAAPLLCSDSAMSFVKVRVVAGNIRTASSTVQQIVFFVVLHWPPAFKTGILLTATFVEFHVVTGRSRSGQVVHRPSLDGGFVPWPWEERHGQSMAWTRDGHGMESVNQTRPHCVNQIGKTHTKPLAKRHGRGTAWARHDMCQSVLRG